MVLLDGGLSAMSIWKSKCQQLGWGPWVIGACASVVPAARAGEGVYISVWQILGQISQQGGKRCGSQVHTGVLL